MLQSEVLYAMLGYTGKVVDADYRLAELPLVDASERELLRRLLHLGHCYSRLDRLSGQGGRVRPAPSFQDVIQVVQERVASAAGYRRKRSHPAEVGGPRIQRNHA